MVGFIRRFLNWLLSFFQKSETPELDAKIEKNKEEIKEIDNLLEEEYVNIEDTKKEWK